MLYVVSTPIGNLKDITLRALEVLNAVDLIACEDTRRAKTLTRHYEISTPLTSYFEHNKIKKGEYLLRLLREGKDIALISDAGTPGISDPGYRIIRLARDNDIEVTAIPGPCALVDALALVGCPGEGFVFLGFLPPKRAARIKRLAEFKQRRQTVVFYESPHRLPRALEDIREVLGDVELVCVREATKKFEETRRAKASRLIASFADHRPRGEFVIIVPHY
ncbi:MAG: 16S rRNA (cytidine(1402)-2'-O)-methyltransferase [Candidatus Omnitrophota bacterium]